MHILTVVLRSGDAPCLNRLQLQRVQRSSVAHKQYLATHPDSDDEGPEDEDAWLYEDLMLLAKLYSRMRDREQLIALIFEVRFLPPRIARDRTAWGIHHEVELTYVWNLFLR